MTPPTQHDVLKLAEQAGFGVGYGLVLSTPGSKDELTAVVLKFAALLAAHISQSLSANNDDQSSLTAISEGQAHIHPTPQDTGDKDPVQHYDDYAVDCFARMMKEKLAKKRAEGRGGWNDPTQCSVEYLNTLLLDHVEKGDPVDVANFCMMLRHYDARIKPAQTTADGEQKRIAKLELINSQLCCEKNALLVEGANLEAKNVHLSAEIERLKQTPADAGNVQRSATVGPCELVQLKKDAERYQWLRQQHWNEAEMFVVVGSKSQVRLGTDCPSLALLDAAIDAAMLTHSHGQAVESAPSATASNKSKGETA
jgi:hypothetical protein